MENEIIMDKADNCEEMNEIEMYRIYEFADGLYFPKEHFQCGNIANYVKTGILSEAEAEEIWNKNVTER